MMTDFLVPLAVCAALLFLCYVLYRFARTIRSGGGSATNFMLGSTELLRNTDQNRAAEVILRKQAGDRFEEEKSGDPE